MAETDPEDLFTPDDNTPTGTAEYDENDIVTLEWNEHIRQRPGMYISQLGDGTKPDDGIYVLFKEVVDNSIDEFVMGFGKRVNVDIVDGRVSVRDFGRGIPLGKLVDVSSKMNTGARFGSDAFKKSLGLNGVGIKAVNAMSVEFVIRSYRDGQMKEVVYSKGEIVSESPIEPTTEENGTYVSFIPDADLFPNYQFLDDFVIRRIKNYTYLNTGLSIWYNNKRFISRNGMLDLLSESMTGEPLYPPVRLKTDDFEVVITHAEQYGEEYYSFVNGQHTTQGGTHLTAFKDAFTRTVKDFYNRNFEPSDIRNGIVAAVSLRMQDPIFDSQAKTRLTSTKMAPDTELTIAKMVGDFVKRELDNTLHREREVADAMLKKIQESEKERRSMAGVTKKAREQAKKISLHNKKLLDCLVHLNDSRGSDEQKLASSIFLTEGDSAAGSITKIRDVKTQAVFALRGKPRNTYGKTKKAIYEDQELNLLQAALNIVDGLDGLRYNKVIIATDADVDGMHIRLLLLTFFLQFFPELIKNGHVYILQTPLFRVRDKNATKRSGSRGKSADKDRETVYYCYSDEERIAAIDRLGANAEITRFKGLGEISPDEFRKFIGPDMRADRVELHREDGVAEMLRFYMGKNTIERQNFIIDNLVVEDDSQIS